MNTNSVSEKPRLAFPKIIISNGTLEGLKWLALLLMTLDHINKYLFNGTLSYLYEAGRLAMPIFVVVLAYNLARPGQLEKKVYQRTMMRLAVWGAIASVPYIALGTVFTNWLPLNILFTLLALTSTAYFIERGNLVAAWGIFLVSGALVEYWWPCLIFGLATWSYFKRPDFFSASIAIIACASLDFINGNSWAMIVFIIVFSATHIDLKMPRIKWFFYIYYPLHLCILWLIRIPMSQAGYLFF